MRLAVDGLCGFLVRSFSKAEDLAALLIEPVPVILNPVLVLDFEVLLVGVSYRLRRQALHAPVVVHEHWHRTNPPFATRSPPERLRPL